MDNEERISQLLREVLADKKDPPLDEKAAFDFAFHLIECAEEFMAFVRMFDHPEEVDLPAAKQIVQALLYHSSGHLVQAARLYDYFPDPFGRRNSEVRLNQSPELDKGIGDDPI